MTGKHAPQGGSEAGFTLIEMLVVLTIMGLLAGIAMTKLSHRPALVDRVRLRSALAEALATARQRAIADGQAVPVDTASLGTIGYRPALGEPNVVLTAFPDGSTNGGTLSLAGHPLLSIDWMTGRIADASR